MKHPLQPHEPSCCCGGSLLLIWFLKVSGRLIQLATGFVRLLRDNGLLRDIHLLLLPTLGLVGIQEFLRVGHRRQVVRGAG
jgi:hypothetical protein